MQGKLSSVSLVWLTSENVKMRTGKRGDDGRGGGKEKERGGEGNGERKGNFFGHTSTFRMLIIKAFKAEINFFFKHFPRISVTNLVESSFFDSFQHFFFFFI